MSDKTVLNTNELKYILSLFTLYNKKGVFELEELVDVGTFSKKLKNILIEKSEIEDAEIIISNSEYIYIFNVIKIATSKIPTILADMESLVFISKKIVDIINEDNKKKEEIKENINENSTITEM